MCVVAELGCVDVSALASVWLADSPLDINEGATGDQVLLIEFPDTIA